MRRKETDENEGRREATPKWRNVDGEEDLNEFKFKRRVLASSVW